MRGVISAMINHAFEKTNILETVGWMLEADEEIRSREDFALGYFIGALMNISVETVKKGKVGVKLIKKAEKDTGKQRLAEIREQIRAKSGRRSEPPETTKEEELEIREMLIPMIARFREKIRKEDALRRV